MIVHCTISTSISPSPYLFSTIFLLVIYVSRRFTPSLPKKMQSITKYRYSHQYLVINCCVLLCPAYGYCICLLMNLFNATASKYTVDRVK